jgi:hypothetical protein
MRVLRDRRDAHAECRGTWAWGLFELAEVMEAPVKRKWWMNHIKSRFKDDAKQAARQAAGGGGGGGGGAPREEVFSRAWKKANAQYTAEDRERSEMGTAQRTFQTWPVACWVELLVREHVAPILLFLSAVLACLKLYYYAKTAQREAAMTAWLYAKAVDTLKQRCSGGTRAGGAAATRAVPVFRLKLEMQEMYVRGRVGGGERERGGGGVAVAGPFGGRGRIRRRDYQGMHEWDISYIVRWPYRGHRAAHSPTQRPPY